MARPDHHVAKAGLIAVLVALAAALALGWDGPPPLLGGPPALPRGPVTLAEIQAYPESHLTYPGARVLAPFGGRERRTLEGTSAAFAGAVLASPDPPAKIYRWYQTWVEAHHWQPATYPLADIQVSLRGYARGTREKLYVAMDDPARLARTLGQSIPGGESVFEVRYLIAPAGAG